MVLRGSHISVHHHVMAEASAHDEEMEDLVGAEIFMLRVEDRQFQRVDHTADGIDDAAGEKPCESSRCESGNDLADRHDAYPAHRDVDHGGEPLRAVDPERVDENPGNRDTPDERQKPVTGVISKDDQANRCVSSGNQDENHHVVDLTQDFINVLGNIKGVVGRAGGIEQNHADDKHSQRRKMARICFSSRFVKQRNCRDHRADHRDKMRQRASGILYVEFMMLCLNEFRCVRCMFLTRNHRITSFAVISIK